MLRKAMPARAVVFVCALLCGCQQKMANQPHVEPLEASAFFKDGRGACQQVEGTIARGQLRGSNAFETGKTGGELVEQLPVELTPGLIARGRERFNIFCSHCHGPAGYGDGMVVQRGFPTPPSYHIPRLQEVPHGHLFNVVSEGIGRMPAFRARIPVQDRWAIVAYVRALQLSQHAVAGELPRDALQRVDGGGDVSSEPEATN